MQGECTDVVARAPERSPERTCVDGDLCEEEGDLGLSNAVRHEGEHQPGRRVHPLHVVDRGHHAHRLHAGANRLFSTQTGSRVATDLATTGRAVGWEYDVELFGLSR